MLLDKRQLLQYIGFFLAGIVLTSLAYTHFQKPAPVQTPPEDNPKPRSVSIPVLAVSAQNENGVLASLTMNMIPRKGDVLISTNPFLEPDTQYSAKEAVLAAQNLTKTDATHNDFVFHFEKIPSQLVGGPSAGSAMALAAVSALNGKPIKNNVAITGTIDSDGAIGPIGDLPEKIKTAAANGVKLLLIPKGQATLTYYQPAIDKQTSLTGFDIYTFRYEPHTLDLKKEAKQKYDMELQEVSNLEEATKYALRG